MRRVKLLAFILFVFVLFSGCSSRIKLKDQEEYTIDDFLVILNSAEEKADSAVEKKQYLTEDEERQLWKEEYMKELKKLGFVSDMEVSVRGNLQYVSIHDDFVVMHLSPEDSKEFIFVIGDIDSCGWLINLERNTNVILRFSITEREGRGLNGYCHFTNAKVVSPSKIINEE